MTWGNLDSFIGTSVVFDQVDDLRGTIRGYVINDQKIRFIIECTNGWIYECELDDIQVNR